MLSRIVEVSGMKISRPNSLKRMSPGSLPKPSFCSAGENQLISISARKTTMIQRIIQGSQFARNRSQRVRPVAHAKAQRVPEGAAVEGDHLEQLAHLVLRHQALRRGLLLQRHGFHQL